MIDDIAGRFARWTVHSLDVPGEFATIGCSLSLPPPSVHTVLTVIFEVMLD